MTMRQILRQPCHACSTHLMNTNSYTTYRPFETQTYLYVPLALTNSNSGFFQQNVFTCFLLLLHYTAISSRNSTDIWQQNWTEILYHEAYTSRQRDSPGGPWARSSQKPVIIRPVKSLATSSFIRKNRDHYLVCFFTHKCHPCYWL
jgi:hypothetical protein